MPPTAQDEWLRLLGGPDLHREVTLSGRSQPRGPGSELHAPGRGRRLVNEGGVPVGRWVLFVQPFVTANS